ncbi:MAG: hypothetical protein Q9166_007807 [cf. Caloplaca sp. 2 TL-2023]
MMSDTPRISTDTSIQEHIWIVQEEYEKPQKEMDFPSANLNGKMPRHDLRINTYSKSDLHDRYMSSEEEPSPSPDNSDAESTASEELKHKSSARVLGDETPLDLSSIESDATTAIAVAMPIVAYGRPKLIDITNLAPMQKRKRAIKQPVAPSTTMAKQTLARTISTPRLSDNKSFVANEAAEVVVPAEKAAIIAQKQAAVAASRRSKEETTQTFRTPSSAPESWLPKEEEEEQTPNNKPNNDEREYHFPSDTEGESEYGPYNLEPIQPSPQRPAHFPRPSRKRNNSNPFTIVTPTNLGKGFTRTWSIAKKGVHHGSSSASTTSGESQRTSSSQQTYQPMERQITKKPKMIARGANEREEPLMLPPFPLDAAA